MNGPIANDPELDALLGAYALDALDPEERARVDEYVAHNPNARDEVDELRESAASLALAPADDAAAPPGLWDRIAETIEAEAPAVAEPPPAPASLADARARRRGWSRPVMAVVGIAAGIAIVVLGAQVVTLGNRLDEARNPGEAGASAAFNRAKSSNGARELALAPSNGAEVARVVLLPDGNGYLKNDTMKKLPGDLTYQLWALTGDPANPTAISAGVLGPDPQAAAFKAAGDDVHGFALTVEHTPGVVSSHQPVYASATIS